ncbi:MAG: MBL fold metallo-hydrolase [Candidatus Atribacteria bacterium]|nr:MAG: MBL fold metallo-hydrolase [Candidatus Atribacteria bacterium]
MSMRNLLLLICVAVSVTVGAAGRQLDVYFIDVGQGDAILVDYGEYEMLIDAGPNGSCAGFLLGYVDGPLEVVVATHPHSDHIGGLDDVLRVFDVHEIVTNGATANTSAYVNFMAAVMVEGCERTIARRNGTIELADLEIRVLHPYKLWGDANEDSLVLSLTFGAVEFLFTGDIEAHTEAELLRMGCLSDIAILKVAHHGSAYSSTPEFLNAAEPKLAIYSAGVGNRYGHPSELALLNLQAISAEILGTDPYGTIRVSTDGERVTSSARSE